MSIANSLWGAPGIHRELLKLGIDVGQTTVAKYMAKGRRPPSQGWKTFLRNHADAVASIDLFVVPTISFRLLYGFLVLRHSRFGEPSRRSAELLALVRGWIARVIRCLTKVRDGIPCGLIEPLSTLHRLRPFSSNRTDPRAVHNPPWPTTLGGDNWTMARRQLSPCRSRASPRRKLPALTNFATIAIARKRQANHNSYNAIVLRVCHEQPAQKPMILNTPSLPGNPSASRPPRTRLCGRTGAGSPRIRPGRQASLSTGSRSRLRRLYANFRARQSAIA